MLALHASSSQETVAMASAIIVTPVGTNLKIMNANCPDNILLDNVVIRNGPTMQRMGLDQNNTVVYSKSIHIAKLQIVGSNATMYGLIVSEKIKLTNKTRQGYLQLRWYTRQQEVANKNDEIVMINASVCIPSNQCWANMFQMIS